jgi:hypothetical protein
VNDFVGGEPSTQWYAAFKRRMLRQHEMVLRNATTGVCDDIVDEDAADRAWLIDAMLIMVRAMNRAVRGCAELAGRSR